MISKKIKYFVFFLFIFLIVLFYKLGYLFFIGQIIIPFQKIFFQPEIKYWQKNLGNLEQEKLKEEVTRLTIENIRLKLLEKENEELKKELNYKKNFSSQRVTASIIGRQSEGGINWFILDQGEEKGIKKGQVVVSGNIVVGKIVKTNRYFSYVLPLTDERATLTALIISQKEKIEEKNKANGLVKGKWGLVLEMDWIPLSKEINIGDYVITAGLEENIEKGLLIGRIERIENRAGAIFQKAIILPEKKLEDLDIVSVIIK